MSVRSIKTGQRIIASPRGFSFWSFVQLCCLLICGLVFFIGMMFYHSHEFDQTSPENYIKSNVAKDRNQVERNQEDVEWLIGRIKYAIANPIPEQHSGLKRDGHGSINDTVFSEAFGKSIKKKEINSGMIYGTAATESPKKSKQKMVRYEDWVDEPENQ